MFLEPFLFFFELLHDRADIITGIPGGSLQIFDYDLTKNDVVIAMKPFPEGEEVSGTIGLS